MPNKIEEIAKYTITISLKRHFQYLSNYVNFKNIKKTNFGENKI